MKIEYRQAVEALIIRHNKILLTKRSPESEVSPNVWCVPAGKLKEYESPEEAVLRETFEEVGYLLKNPKLLYTREHEFFDKEIIHKRTLYTFFLDGNSLLKEPLLNFEHTHYAWVSKEELFLPEYGTLFDILKQIILIAFNCSDAKNSN